jgi:hypothetical protein
MKRLRFLHIPKTAGLTLTTILRRQYIGKKKFYFTGDFASDINRFEALSECDRGNVVLFCGHAPIVTGVKEADNATIITFLRDPIDRVKSFVQHVSEGKSSHLINEFPPESFNVDQFLESGNEELSNLQTKMLINNKGCGCPLLIEKMSAPAARDAALDNLYGRISYWGLQEYFNESLILFSSTLNLRMPVYASVNMRNTSRLIKFEEHHLEWIVELNAIDIELYRLAKEQFISRLNSVAFDGAKLKRFRVINSFCSPVIHIARGIKVLLAPSGAFGGPVGLTRGCANAPSP